MSCDYKRTIMRTDDALHGPRDVLAYETNLTTLVISM